MAETSVIRKNTPATVAVLLRDVIAIPLSSKRGVRSADVAGAADKVVVAGQVRPAAAVGVRYVAKVSAMACSIGVAWTSRWVAILLLSTMKGSSNWYCISISSRTVGLARPMRRRSSVGMARSLLRGWPAHW